LWILLGVECIWELKKPGTSFETAPSKASFISVYLIKRKSMALLGGRHVCPNGIGNCHQDVSLRGDGVINLEPGHAFGYHGINGGLNACKVTYYL
jgi:hypothetical protein